MSSTKRVHLPYEPVMGTYILQVFANRGDEVRHTGLSFRKRDGRTHFLFDIQDKETGPTFRTPMEESQEYEYYDITLIFLTNDAIKALKEKDYEPYHAIRNNCRHISRKALRILKGHNQITPVHFEDGSNFLMKEQHRDVSWMNILVRIGVCTAAAVVVTIATKGK
jgi:hypothetical protein